MSYYLTSIVSSGAASAASHLLSRSLPCDIIRCIPAASADKLELSVLQELLECLQASQDLSSVREKVHSFVIG